MSIGDYRVVEGNSFHIYEFSLPDLRTSDSITLSYENVLRQWEMPYLTHQGATFYNGRILFAAKDIMLPGESSIRDGEAVIIFNPETGVYEAMLPLKEQFELEGISVFNDEIYLSYTKGSRSSAGNVFFKINKVPFPKEIL